MNRSKVDPGVGTKEKFIRLEMQKLIAALNAITSNCSILTIEKSPLSCAIDNDIKLYHTLINFLPHAESSNAGILLFESAVKFSMLPYSGFFS